MAGDVGIDGAVVLDAEDMFRTVLLVHRPVVDELVQQAVLSRVNHLLGILYRLPKVFLALCVSQVIIYLSPSEIDLCQCCVGCSTSGTTNVAESVFAGFWQPFCSIFQIVYNLLIYFCL